MPDPTPEPPFASRAGLKLAHALDAFDVDVAGLVCADFGCNVGGFTDCLLRRGAARVYAIDTGYGTLAYRLRRDGRVVVMERSNALHVEPRPDPAVGAFDGVDLVTIDLAWTPQRLAIPAARRWLRRDGRIISLVKPHYELADDERSSLLVEGRLDPHRAPAVFRRVVEAMPPLGVEPIACTRSPVTGAKSARRGPGNVEYLVLLGVRVAEDCDADS